MRWYLLELLDAWTWVLVPLSVFTWMPEHSECMFASPVLGPVVCMRVREAEETLHKLPEKDAEPQKVHPRGRKAPGCSFSWGGVGSGKVSGGGLSELRPLSWNN